MMREPHVKAINDFLALYSAKSEFIAILLVGSLAHGFAKANSDVDIVLVATDKEFQKQKKKSSWPLVCGIFVPMPADISPQGCFPGFPQAYF
jgi:predicted nucleotidyltransferase